MGKGIKNVRHVRQLDTSNLYARSYAVRLAKQVAEELDRERRPPRKTKEGRTGA